jgi:hypothetical protein
MATVLPMHPGSSLGFNLVMRHWRAHTQSIIQLNNNETFGFVAQDFGFNRSHYFSFYFIDTGIVATD